MAEAFAAAYESSAVDRSVCESPCVELWLPLPPLCKAIGMEDAIAGMASRKLPMGSGKGKPQSR